MHLLYIVRSQQSLEKLYLLLDDVLDPRMYSSFHTTTASAPSLRASAAESYASMALPVQDDPGNIKVVVRCRTFVWRGMLCAWLGPAPGLTRNRERKGYTMSDPHGPCN
jgi:hypothetical protein